MQISFAQLELMTEPEKPHITLLPNHVARGHFMCPIRLFYLGLKSQEDCSQSKVGISTPLEAN